MRKHLRLIKEAIQDFLYCAKLSRMMRPCLIAFAIEMEWQLKENDHKGGWQDLAPEHLLRRLREETDELEAALKSGENVLEEAADVANFAMMIGDNWAMAEARKYLELKYGIQYEQ